MAKNPLKKYLRVLISLLSGCVSFFLWEGPHNALYASDSGRIVGSTAIFPFSAIIAERLSLLWEEVAPIIERTGTGAGIKLFCGGEGPKFPGIINASRQMNPSERQLCFRNGVQDIVEFKIGYGGIILAKINKKDKKGMEDSFVQGMTLEDLYKGLAKNILQEGKWVSNPYTTWKEVNPRLPNIPILVFGPPPTSGVRDSIKELVFEPFCTAVQGLCFLIREDGKYVEVPENTKLIIQKMVLNSHSIGILGYPFWEQNQDILKALPIENNFPSLQSIFKGTYPLTRLFYMYVKKSALYSTPPLRRFLEEFMSEDVWSEEGSLAYKGLIPPPKRVRTKSRKILQALFRG